MLIFTKGVLEQFSTVETLLGATSGESEACLEELPLAIFFLNERIGGHPTTEAGAVLFFFASLGKG